MKRKLTSNEITINRRHVPEVGGDRWILSCSLFKGDDAPTINLLISHDYSTNENGESNEYQAQIVHDYGDRHFVVTDEEYSNLVDLCYENEKITREDAEKTISNRYLSNSDVRMLGGDALHLAEEMWKRWQAIKLIVTPTVTF